MLNYFAVGFGGALGAMLRFFVYNRFAATGNASLFAWPTLTVNVIGSLCMGIAWYYLVEKAILPPVGKNFAMTGLLGALTTFSTFSLDALRLLQADRLAEAFAYVITSVVFCLIVTWAGYSLGNMMDV